MHKLISNKNLTSDVIIKNHHQYHHQHQLQEHNLPLKTIQTKTSQSAHQLKQQSISQQQQQQHHNHQHKQQQQQQQQYQRHQNESTNKIKVKEINSYEKFTGSNTIKSISDIQPSKVKMSGYLKKKRTKVGGWRKMWFVLQNQLLLSYSSKENYDKKLVSFKDVLNLVPGTTIHPLGSFRFAIETTTNVMYNFRCDDSQSYNLWLNALVESLSLNLQQQRSTNNKDNNNSSAASSSDNNKQQKFKNSISLDNIQRTTPPNKKPIKSCNSSDSISRFNLSRTPNIPIADATAKILQRNGIPSTGTNNVNNNEFQMKKAGHNNDRHRNGSTHNNGNCSGNNDGNRNNRQHHDQLETYCEKQERARNFRLHEKRLSSGMLQQNLHQSDEVSRINRMFSRSRSANNVATTVTANSTFNILNDRNSFVVSTSTTATTSTKTATITSSSISTPSSTAKTTVSKTSPCSSIVNIVNNPIVNKVKPSLSSSSLPLSTSSIITASGTSVGIASIVSLKEGNGRYNIDNKQARKNLLNCNQIEFINYNSYNNNSNSQFQNYIGAHNLDDNNQYHHYHHHQQQQHSDFHNKFKCENKKSQSEKYLNQNINNNYHNNNYRDTNLFNNNNNYSDCNGQNKFIKNNDKRNSNQFFPIMMPTNNIMTKDNNPIFNNDDEKDIIIAVTNRNNTCNTDSNTSYSNNSGNNSSNSECNNSNRNSPIKYNNHENKNNGDNNDSKNLHKNINDGNNGDKNDSCNKINKNNFTNSANDLRDLNQNRMFGVSAEYYEKIDDFQKDKAEDDAYECYPLQQKMQDLNICKHQQPNVKQNEVVELHNKSDKRIMTQNSEKSSTSSPFKKSISLERTGGGGGIGQNPFLNESEFSINSMNPFNSSSSSASSPHQSLQIFSHNINSPGKDEISLSSSSTTSNSRCNSSLVTTESNNSMTNSPINDGSLFIQQQQQRLQCSYSNRPKILDSRIHPALQPSESMEEDLHILVHNDGEGESHTEDIVLNDIDGQRPASAQCLSSIRNGTGVEPIYALVDLKNKHARRAKLKELQDQLKMLTEARDRERPRSLQCISSDYEEVLNFECMQDEDEDGEEEDEDEDENENIYEPINIPEYAQRQQQHSQRHALWKYFRRINIEALLELARNKKIRSPRNTNKKIYEGTNLHPTMSLPADAYSHHQQNQQTSPFSDIRRKLGR
ncbi:probable serine/threonine-protein kinase DDB_G0282963 isoform X2 [Condylostylus longicornis]|uniref:probable serine/threonine-protein kinase DDB_G0282963 isoform X2 n=1 Tax=Condylostylus longicornis TaxID=2530218 RepID=UPI00244DCC86|nr:probable serine/threonine-protein kinase DDB_G0282963 isoform X2 [Condylostylus longicornis]